MNEPAQSVHIGYPQAVEINPVRIEDPREIAERGIHS